jgi:hypothetical protein
MSGGEQQKALESRVASELAEFSEKNPEFNKLWDAGDIHKYMDEHPISGPKDAYYALTQEAREADTQKRIDGAVAEAALPAPIALGASRRVMWDRVALDAAIAARAKRRGARPERWTEAHSATGRVGQTDPFAAEV